MKRITALSYLHSVVHGRDSVYTAFTDRVGAHSDVLLQLVQVGELGRAAVHLEAERFVRSRSTLLQKVSLTLRLCWWGKHVAIDIKVDTGQIVSLTWV